MQDRVLFLLDFSPDHQLFSKVLCVLADISLLSVFLGMKVTDTEKISCLFAGFDKTRLCSVGPRPARRVVRLNTERIKGKFRLDDNPRDALCLLSDRIAPAYRRRTRAISQQSHPWHDDHRTRGWARHRGCAPRTGHHFLQRDGHGPTRQGCGSRCR